MGYGDKVLSHPLVVEAIESLDGLNTVLTDANIYLGAELLTDAAHAARCGCKFVGGILLQNSYRAVQPIIQQMIGDTAADDATSHDKDIICLLSHC